MEANNRGDGIQLGHPHNLPGVINPEGKCGKSAWNRKGGDGAVGVPKEALILTTRRRNPKLSYDLATIINAIGLGSNPADVNGGKRVGGGIGTGRDREGEERREHHDANQRDHADSTDPCVSHSALLYGEGR